MVVVVRLMAGGSSREVIRSDSSTLKTCADYRAFPLHDGRPRGQVFDCSPFTDEARGPAEAASTRSCYLRAVRVPSLSALLLLVPLACTETPSSFPPCVDPNAPCVVPDAGSDASEAAVSDAAPGEATPQDAR